MAPRLAEAQALTQLLKLGITRKCDFTAVELQACRREVPGVRQHYVYSKKNAALGILR